MTATIRPGSPTELMAALRDATGTVRIVGSGSRQHRLPEAGAATRLALGGLDRIERLDAGDQTCSVGPGVRREALDEAAAEHGLWLPCAGTGTIGGLFASDPIGAVSAGAPQPRSLLLGIEGVTADGTGFRSGARVAKSVAGFDLHRLFVGSRGRLFAATLLHLRLKPRPRASSWFRNADLTAAEALGLFLRLRAASVPPAALHLLREHGDCAVVGRIDGRPSFVERTMREFELAPGEPLEHHQLTAAGAGEVLAGALRPSLCLKLLATASDQAPFVLHGGGRFELALATPADTDAVLGRLPVLGVHACITEGAASRRGHGTPLDPGQERLADSLIRTFDPHGILV